MRPLSSSLAAGAVALLLFAPEAAWAQGLNVVLSCPVGQNSPSTPQNPLIVTNAQIEGNLQPGDSVNQFTCQILIGNQTGQALQGVQLQLTLPQTVTELYDPAQHPDGMWVLDYANESHSYSLAHATHNWLALGPPAGFPAGTWVAASRTYTWTQDLSADANATVELRVRVSRDRRVSLGQDEVIRLVTTAPGGVTVPAQENRIREDGSWAGQWGTAFSALKTNNIDPSGGYLNLLLSGSSGSVAANSPFNIPLQRDVYIDLYMPYAVRDAGGAYTILADGNFNAANPNHTALVDYNALAGHLEFYTFNNGLVASSGRLVQVVNFGQGQAAGPLVGPNAGRMYRWDAARQVLRLTPGLLTGVSRLTSGISNPGVVSGGAPSVRLKAPMRFSAVTGGGAALAGLQVPLRYCYSSRVMRELGPQDESCATVSYAVAPDAQSAALYAGTSLSVGGNETVPLQRGGSERAAVSTSGANSVVQLVNATSKPLAEMNMFFQLPGDTQRRAAFTRAFWGSRSITSDLRARGSIYVTTAASSYGSPADLTQRVFPSSLNTGWMRCGLGDVCEGADAQAAGAQPANISEVRWSLTDLEPGAYDLSSYYAVSTFALLDWTEQNSSPDSINGALPSSFKVLTNASIGSAAARVDRTGPNTFAAPVLPSAGRLWVEVGALAKVFNAIAAASTNKFVWNVGTAPATTNERLGFACAIGDYSQAYNGLRLPATFEMILPLNFDPRDPADPSRLTVRPFRTINNANPASAYHLLAQVGLAGRDRSYFAPYDAAAMNPQWTYTWDAATRLLRVTINRLPTGSVDMIVDDIIGVEVEGLILPGVAREITITSPTNPARRCDITLLTDRNADGVYVGETITPALAGQGGDAALQPVTSVAPSISFPTARATPNQINGYEGFGYELEVTNAAWQAGGQVANPGATTSAREVMLFQRVTRAGDYPAVEQGGARSLFVRAEPGDASKIYVSTAASPALGDTSDVAGNAAQWRLCATAPTSCDAAALAALGLTAAQVRWVGFALDEVLVTDAEPRGVAPRYGAARVNNTYKARLFVRDDGSMQDAIIRAQAQLHTMDAAPSATVEPLLDVRVNAACNTSDPTVGPGKAELCDGKDNDCDGAIDEAFAALGTTCSVGVGACVNAGVTICAVNQQGTTCSVQPRQPGVELCGDMIDNDCDSQIDEGFNVGAACSAGQGACQSAGAFVCRADRLGTVCNAVAGQPQAERCDGLDNDCDGVADDGFNVGGACTRSFGSCQVTGALACAMDGSASCNLNPATAPDGDGDGVPNSCDCAPADATRFTMTPGVAGSCDGDGDGYCSAQIAQPNAALCTQGGDCDDADAAIHPGASELCDGEDNDCDAQIDEDFATLGDACSAGEGACQNAGTLVCDAAGAGVRCSAVAGQPGAAELCDGSDNDCDGQIDEGFVDLGAACEVDFDGCKAAGAVVCSADGAATMCALTAPDGDGDGVPDACDCAPEQADYYTMAPGVAGSCDEDGDGACRPELVNPDAALCPTVDCDDADATVFPGASELCDGEDNDCDAQVDEDFAQLGMSCMADACALAGQIVCTMDGLGVVCSTMEADPSKVEACNNLDDDCDGQIDEGFGLGEACEVGVGECRAAGVKACAMDGTVVCEGRAELPGPEVCDGLDNDCDGEVDELDGGAMCPDGDGDGVPDWDDNCPGINNPDQRDSDGDGVGDACESEEPGEPDALEYDAQGFGVTQCATGAPAAPASALLWLMIAGAIRSRRRRA